MRRLWLLLTVLALTACSKIDSNPASVFEHAFSMPSPPSGVVALHGYRMERSKWFVRSDQMWRMHLAGPDAKKFVRQHWSDLRLGNPRVFFQGTQTPWFAPGKDLKQYATLISPSNPAVTVMESQASDEVFIAYDAPR